MNEVFKPFIGRYVLFFFLNEILIYSIDEKEHIQHLKITLEMLRKHQLYVKGFVGLGVKRSFI